jgi:hypothetical protein
MRRIILAELLVACAVFVAGALFILWRIPTVGLAEVTLTGRVVATDCGNHGQVSYEFQYLGRSYSANGSGVDCSSARAGQPLTVWVPRGHPDWSALSSQQTGPHSAFWQAGALGLIFAAYASFAAFRLVKGAGKRLGRGPWSIGGGAWPSS